MAEWNVENSHGGFVQNAAPSQLGNFLQVTGGTANVKGSWAVVIASTAFAASGMLISFAGTASNASYLMDIGMGPSPTEVVIVPDLLWASHQLRTTCWFYAPLPIPAGSRLVARCQCSTAAQDMRMSVHLVAAGAWSKPPCSKILAFGADTANSSGAQMDPGAVANAFAAAYADITTSTGADICGISYMVGGVNNTAPANGSFEVLLGVGTLGNEVEVINGERWASGATGDNYGPRPGWWLSTQILAGNRLAMKSKSSVTDATDRLFKVVAYGLVK